MGSFDGGLSAFPTGDNTSFGGLDFNMGGDWNSSGVDTGNWYDNIPWDSAGSLVNTGIAGYNLATMDKSPYGSLKPVIDEMKSGISGAIGNYTSGMGAAAGQYELDVPGYANNLAGFKVSDLTTPIMTGKLPAGWEQLVGQTTQRSSADLNAAYAGMGLTGIGRVGNQSGNVYGPTSTMQAQDLANIYNKGTQLRYSMASDMYDKGLRMYDMGMKEAGSLLQARSGEQSNILNAWSSYYRNIGEMEQAAISAQAQAQAQAMNNMSSAMGQSSGSSGSSSGGMGDIIGTVADIGMSLIGSVICTKLYKKGRVTPTTHKRLWLRARSYSSTTLRGYWVWAVPYTQLMDRSNTATEVALHVFLHIAKQDTLGKIYEKAIVTVSNVIGQFVDTSYVPAHLRRVCHG